MLKTYHVMLQPGGTIDCGLEGPPTIPAATPVEVVLPTIAAGDGDAPADIVANRPRLQMPDETPEERAARGVRLRQAFEALAASNPFRDIADPVEWQREQRRERPLPGREE